MSSCTVCSPEKPAQKSDASLLWETFFGLLVGGLIGYFGFGLSLGVVISIQLTLVFVLGGLLATGGLLLKRDERKLHAQFGGHEPQEIRQILSTLDREFPAGDAPKHD